MVAAAGERRLLLVHAHPDDETINNGALMAHYAAAGAAVTLVTCTLGEEGEILVPSLAQLAADEADQLGGIRIMELVAAMQALGVTDHRFLGGAGRFRDSGMLGTAANSRARAFWRADRDPAVFAAAVAALVEIIREVRPHVVITYDDRGGYGHPDHVMAHRVTTAALGAASDQSVASRLEPWSVAKLYWIAIPRSSFARDRERVEQSGLSFSVPDPADGLATTIEDCLVTTAIDGSAQLPAKLAALSCHATQVTVDGAFFALSNGIGQVVHGVEYLRLVHGELAGDRDRDGRETDVFAGVA